MIYQPNQLLTLDVLNEACDILSTQLRISNINLKPKHMTHEATDMDSER